MTHLFTRIFSSALMGLTASTVLATDTNPTTAPAAVATAVPVLKHDPRVQVFPFTAVSGAPVGQDWTGRGIQEDLQSDVSRTGATLIMPARPAAANEDAIASARQNGADLIVTGTYQIVDDQIRANGHVIDVATNTPIGGFSSTGSQHDLFKVEDALGEQLRALLPRQMTADQIRQTFDQPQPTVVYQQSEPTYVSPPATVNNYYDTTPVTPAYTYPDYNYDYGYPYGYGGGFLFVSPGFGSFHHDGDHGFHDHGFGGRGTFTPHPVFRGGTTGIGRGGSLGGSVGGGIHIGGGSFGGHGGGGGRR